MTAMVEDGDGNIWFGTDGGGIYFGIGKITNTKYIKITILIKRR